MITTRRVYETGPAKSATFLVDRLWPRGIRKEELKGVQWLKDAAPSTTLRLWFRHDPSKHEEFLRRYRIELDQHPESWQPILEAARKGPAVLLYSSRDTVRNNAEALKAYLEEKLGAQAKRGGA
jgi:uncharacterized protein YeaO (DUF488 family)